MVIILRFMGHTPAQTLDHTHIDHKCSKSSCCRDATEDVRTILGYPKNFFSEQFLKKNLSMKRECFLRS